MTSYHRKKNLQYYDNENELDDDTYYNSIYNVLSGGLIQLNLKTQQENPITEKSYEALTINQEALTAIDDLEKLLIQLKTKSVGTDLKENQYQRMKKPEVVSIQILRVSIEKSQKISKKMQIHLTTK